jgi:hypothetical protein
MSEQHSQERGLQTVLQSDRSSYKVPSSLSSKCSTRSISLNHYQHLPPLSFTHITVSPHLVFLEAILFTPVAMCYHVPIDKIAVPCMNDIEGITTMPVGAPTTHEGRLQSLANVLTSSGSWPPLPCLPRTRRYRVGDPWQGLPAVRYSCQLDRRPVSTPS